MTTNRRLAPLLTIVLLIAPTSVRADEGGLGRRIWHGVAATAMNVLPVVSVFASQRCLPGYVACKLSFAGMGALASGVQLVAGGDVDGAKRTAERAFGGDWIVLPRHLATGVQADPYPEAASDEDADETDLPSF